MKQFLSVWSQDAERLGVALTEDAIAGLNQYHGRTSPLLPAVNRAILPDLPQSGAVLLLIPEQPSNCLAVLMNDMGTAVAERSYLSYGHASIVLILNGVGDAEDVVATLGELIRGYEIWPFNSGSILLSDIVSIEPSPAPEWPVFSAIGTDDLGFEASAQIRQFNGNLALLTQVVARYMPEARPLIVWLEQSVRDIAASLQTIFRDRQGDDTAIRQGISLESLLVELNAVVTLYCSQLSSGVTPLHVARFPVGEYSLLGIGGVTRTAWRLYFHLNDTFGRFDHPGLFARQYSIRPPFDPFAPIGRLSFADWYKSKLNIGEISDDARTSTRLHMPYFSSRWGFHESMHSISVSWQCIHASATKEWNLLTLTHEFIHSHVRDLVGKILDPNIADAETLVKRYNAKECGANTIEALQMAYIASLININAGSRAADSVQGSRNERTDSNLQRRISVKNLIDLLRTEKGLVDEIIVHVLDYLYVYSGREDIYVNSIWSSWSLIPSVNDRIEHYLLRTICALSAQDDDSDNRTVFDAIVHRLTAHLHGMRGRPRVRPAIDGAIAYLADERNRARLYLQFMFARYIVHMTVAFLYDPKLNAELLRDDNTTVRDGVSTYAIDVGDFRGETIASPIGFLLDRFPGYSDQAGGGSTEYEGLWQMLQLV
jgi:hypothetical protein